MTQALPEAIVLAAGALLDWAGLLQVLLFALVASAVIVTAFSFGLVGLDRYQRAVGADGTGAHRGGAAGSLAIAIACFAVCAAAVGAGLWAIVAR